MKMYIKSERFYQTEALKEGCFSDYEDDEGGK